MQVCPSILEYKAEDYFATIKKLSLYYQYLQLDFADGVYVKNKTAALDDFISVLKQQFNNLTMKQFTFDFHLMVKNYQENIKKLEGLKKILKIKNVLIHFDLFPNYSLLTTHSSLFSIGLVLNPQDRIDNLASKYNLNSITTIQIMSVNPGAQGTPFLPETLKKIEQLRLVGYRNKIFLDGAVNDRTMPIINSKKYRPDFVCPGSYLAKAPEEELKKRVDYLLQFT